VQLRYRSADTGAWKDWAKVEVIDTRPGDVPWPPSKPGGFAPG